MKNQETLTKIINWGIVVLVFLLPLFFLPITTEFYVFNKQTLLILGTGILLFFWALRIFKEKGLNFKRTPLDLAVILFTLVYVLVTLIASPNKTVAFMDSISTATILCLAILYFIITNNLQLDAIRYTLYANITSAAILALIAFYQFIGVGEEIARVDWLKSTLFTPTGNPLTLATFLGIGLVLALTLFLKRGRKGWLAATPFFLVSLLILFGLTVTVYQIIPASPASGLGRETGLTILPYKDGWVIAAESFKQNPLFGVGFGNYLSAFNRFRPISFNNYDFWNTRFGRASNLPFEILTTGGLVTLSAYLFLLIKSGQLWWKNHQSRKNDNKIAILIALLALLATQFTLPTNFLSLFFIFLFLALLAAVASSASNLNLGGKNITLGILGLVAILILSSFYLWSRVYLADVYFRQSLNAVIQNRGIEAYNLQIKAITLNPTRETYRIAYSQTTFALANVLAERMDLSDQDRNDISQLVQQAIREAKVATVLNQKDATGWENLAQIYRNLINFAQGADQWAVASYQQAILTDPINPRIRLNLGGLYFALANYDEAVRHFQNAISLKPDYANAYYNLAAAYREQEKYLEAFRAMQIVVNLVPADSVDYQTAFAELEELRDKLPSAEAPAEVPTEPGELTPPEPLPSPAIEPVIELPEEAGPEISPSPSPEVTPEATPTL